MTKLLNCPFCGGGNVVACGGSKEWVHCKGCGTVGPTATTTSKAIAAWNRRAPDPETAALKARVAELRRALSEQMAWVQCWIRDAECELVPTMNSLQRAEREIADALAKGGADANQ